MAAYHAFRDGTPEPAIDDHGRYHLLWSFYAGTWTRDPAVRTQRRNDVKLYANTRQLWRQADAIVSTYEQFVYAGDLSTDGRPLPDGTRGAIPIDPQTGGPESDAALLRAFGELFALWNWRQYMSLRPKMGAILGDCLTELVDDLPAGKVLPRLVWPGYVVDLDLDLVGNVKAYTLQYRVEEPASNAYGRTTAADSYEFRKEVDGRAIRYYRDGRPFAYPELGDAVQPNPYGFVPAIWDRHQIVWGERGMSAIERTLQAVMEMNSVLSHALDFQRRQFSTPVGVKGSAIAAGGRQITLPGGITVGRPGPVAGAEFDAERTKRAEEIDLLPMDENGAFVSLSVSTGSTTDLLRIVMDAILAEQPEARYGQEILRMSQVSAPGISRALAPVIGKIKLARASYDPQTVKLLQMATAITGHNLSRDAYPESVVRDRPSRYEAFRPFDLTSYGKGLLDCSIPDREVFPLSRAERLADLAATEQLTDPWFLQQAGVPEQQVARISRERSRAQPPAGDSSTPSGRVPPAPAGPAADRFGQ